MDLMLIRHNFYFYFYSSNLQEAILINLRTLQQYSIFRKTKKKKTKKQKTKKKQKNKKTKNKKQKQKQKDNDQS